VSIGTGGFFPPYPGRFRGLIPIALKTMPGLVLYPTGLVAHDTADVLAQASALIRLVRVAPDPTRIPHELDDASPGALARLREEADRVVATDDVRALFAELQRESARG
jgi:hypothetical protein